MSTKLLSYMRYLREIISQSIFDYSAIHVVSRWLTECLSEPSALFASVKTHVNALADILLLASGLGLSEMWATMSHQVAGPKDDVKIRHLDSISQILPSSKQGA